MGRTETSIIAYYAFSFLVGFYLANGTTVLFEQKLGLSYTQIFTLDAMYMLMFILFEIPSGALADLLGRKKTMLVGAFVLCLGALATGSAQTFYHLFLTFFLWAFGFSLISGSGEAMLYDTINDEKRYHRVYGRSWSFSILGMALSGIVGPLLFAEHFRLPYLLSSIPFVLAFVALLFFREEHAQREQFSIRGYLRQVKEGAQFAIGNRHVIWSMAALSLVFAVGYTFTSAYQPYLIAVGFTVTQFSFILPIMFLIEAGGGSWSEKATNLLGENKAFLINFTLLGASLLMLGLFARKEAIPFLFLYSFLQGFLRPLVSTYAHRYIRSDIRATVTSVQVTASTIAASAMLFSFGFLTDRIGVIALSTAVGVLVLIVGSVLLITKPKSN